MEEHIKQTSHDLAANISAVEAALNLEQVSTRLNISYSSALRLVRDGSLRAFRVRGSWRTSEAALREFVEKAFAEQSIYLQSVEVEE